MLITFTSDESWKRAEEITEHLRGPRLWIPRTDYPDLEAWTEKVCAQLRREEKRAMVAIVGGSVVAAVVYQRKGGSGKALEVKNISVRPDQRGRHIASFLLRNAEIEGARDFGTSRVVVDAKARNLEVRSFLTRNGYVPKEVSDLYGLGAGEDVTYLKRAPLRPGSSGL
jgi:ribosomal protein S18 acetylase RimI-like enzyme